MIPTFVIGLREGLEAALIVGIIAAFLRTNGQMRALRLVWAGVAIAVAICAAVAVGLQLWSAELPQAQQEGLETIVGLAAVVMGHVHDRLDGAATRAPSSATLEGVTAPVRLG